MSPNGPVANWGVFLRTFEKSRRCTLFGGPSMSVGCVQVNGEVSRADDDGMLEGALLTMVKVAKVKRRRGERAMRRGEGRRNGRREMPCPPEVERKQNACTIIQGGGALARTCTQIHVP